MEDAASREEALNTIQRNGNHLLELINDALDVSKIEAGKMSLETVPINPWEIVKEVSSMLADYCIEQGNSIGRKMQHAVAHQHRV